jgi:O-antigen/teichoic acid export membrane protein
VLRRTALLFITTLGAFSLVIALTGDLPATLVYGSRYSGVGPILSLLSVSMLVGSLGITAGNGLWAMERPAANFAADVCTFAVTIGSAILLVGPLGILGAAMAILAGSSAGTLVRFFTLSRLLADADLGAGRSRRLQPATDARHAQAEACDYAARASLIGEPAKP